MDDITTINADAEVFLTDAELMERWHCSEMKLWRMRHAGILRKPMKVGGGGRNLTSLADVRAVEGASHG